MLKYKISNLNKKMKIIVTIRIIVEKKFIQKKRIHMIKIRTSKISLGEINITITEALILRDNLMTRKMKIGDIIKKNQIFAKENKIVVKNLIEILMKIKMNK